MVLHIQNGTSEELLAKGCYYLCKSLHDFKRGSTSTCKSGIFHRKTSQSHEILTAENGQKLGQYEDTAGKVGSFVTTILFLP